MPAATPAVPIASARRLAVERQHLPGARRRPRGGSTLGAVLRDLAFVQVDPVSTVAPSQVLALWNRIEGFQPADLERGLDDRRFLQVCIPPAGIVAADDYPLHRSLMVRYPESLSDSWGSQRTRAREWLRAHAALRESVLAQLDGAALTVRQFEGHVRTGRREDGWTSGSDVAVMLGYLEMTGEVLTVGHEGPQKLWARPEDVLPPSVDRTPVTPEALERECAQRALRAMGVATPGEIEFYFPRGRYLDPAGALRGLEDEGRIRRVALEGRPAREIRYVHLEDEDRLEALAAPFDDPAISLLPPFDNLIHGRQRTNRLFDFDYTHGNYLPAAKRRFGVFVLPILWGERIIGRCDARCDRTTAQLVLPSVHAEPGAPRDPEIGARIRERAEELGRFVGTPEVVVGAIVPKAWASGLRRARG